MKDFSEKSAHFNRVEFWAACTLFAFFLFFFITEGQDTYARQQLPNRRIFERAGISFDYYANYFIPSLIRYVFLFGAFGLLNFTVVPQLIRRESLVRNVILVVMLLVAGGLVLGATDTYLKAYLFNDYATAQETYDHIFARSFLYALWLLLLLGLYSLVKYAGVYLLSRAGAIQARFRFVTTGGLVTLVVWMIGLFCFGLGTLFDDWDELLAAWMVVVPAGVGLYWLSLHVLIPRTYAKKRAVLRYLANTVLVLAVTFLPIALVLVRITGDEDEGFALGGFNAVCQLLITAPLSWVLFKRRLRGNEEVYALQTQLGQSTANLDFLRSQINPHFLFNALNTIYGTAIQENAERTRDGIEKLADMMRFMLRENTQEQIPLAREVEYLGNYISFQKLRTDPNPAVRIQAEIAEPSGPVRIAPMLLIPFVENAFKHGISLREPSHISISLEMKENILYFDVHNSKHAKQGSDPERDKSGIGLNNVRQRLQQLYPVRHELTIRETAKEFFVHLTLRLG
ncbi:MAG TPA: histidine kinase [Cytophagales bacterium]